MFVYLCLYIIYMVYRIGLKCAQLRIPLRDDVRQQLPSSSNWKLIINPHCSVSNEYLMLTAPSEWYI